MLLSASILSCNAAFLGDTVRKLEAYGADLIHIDIMDGHYVDNFTFGPKTVSDIKHISSLPMEVHLEVFDPEKYITMFAEAGADIIIVQLDCCYHPIRCLKKIRKFGIKAGVAVTPAEGIHDLCNILDYVDEITLMSVEPGFGGQHFEYSCIEKISALMTICEKKEKKVSVSVDGGINYGVAEILKQNGVDKFIIGTGLFFDEDIQNTIEKYKG